MGRFFGTDGVRGIANRDLTPELAFGLGWAGGMVLRNNAGRPKIVVGRDTRVSGEMLEAAIVSGLTCVGADVILVGIMPTPAIAYLTRQFRADAGIVISASHNPVEYNGIKFFSGDGYKLCDEVENEIERVMMEAERIHPECEDVGQVEVSPDAEEEYISHAINTVNCDFSGLKIVVDCGYGASYRITPKVLKALGAEVIAINDDADGMRINVCCGSTNPDIICRKVKETGANLGIAHDGDADRVIACDEKGNIVDGDHIMAVCALHLMGRNQLPKNTIVATAYSNLGLIRTLKNAGGFVLIAENGDRYVLEKMREEGLTLGGEKWGHVIFLEHNSTGDGLVTALQLISVMKERNEPLSSLASILQEYPQVLVNVPVRDKAGLKANSRVKDAVRRGEELLGEDGRLFARASGTEPLIRIMGEGPDEVFVKNIVNEVANVIREELE